MSPLFPLKMYFQKRPVSPQLHFLKNYREKWLLCPLLSLKKLSLCPLFSLSGKGWSQTV